MTPMVDSFVVYGALVLAAAVLWPIGAVWETVRREWPVWTARHYVEPVGRQRLWLPVRGHEFVPAPPGLVILDFVPELLAWEAVRRSPISWLLVLWARELKPGVYRPLVLALWRAGCFQYDPQTEGRVLSWRHHFRPHLAPLGWWRIRHVWARCLPLPFPGRLERSTGYPGAVHLRWDARATWGYRGASQASGYSRFAWLAPVKALWNVVLLHFGPPRPPGASSPWWCQVLWWGAYVPGSQWLAGEIVHWRHRLQARRCARGAHDYQRYWTLHPRPGVTATQDSCRACGHTRAIIQGSYRDYFDTAIDPKR